jgi:hypothetical protein
VFNGDLNPKGAKNWLMNLEELLRAIDWIEEHRVKCTAYKFSREARQWWCMKKD